MTRTIELVALGLTGAASAFIAAAWVTGRHYSGLNRIAASVRSRDRQMRLSADLDDGPGAHR
jgi:hypothetical protein